MAALIRQLQASSTSLFNSGPEGDETGLDTTEPDRLASETERLKLLFQRINRSDTEAVYTIVLQHRRIIGSDHRRLCLRVVDCHHGRRGCGREAATATLSCLVGVAAQDIANSAYGKVQVYGYKQSAWVYNNQTTAIAAGTS